LLAVLLACGGREEPAEKVIDVEYGNAILADYKDNEIRGDHRWKGKVVRLSGVVGVLGKDFLDHSYIAIGDGLIADFHCNLAEGQDGRAANLSRGQRAMFKGRVGGKTLGSIFLEECQIVPGAAPAAPAKAPPPPPRKR
jgi:hypothetical protein